MSEPRKDGRRIATISMYTSRVYDVWVDVPDGVTDEELEALGRELYSREKLLTTEDVDSRTFELFVDEQEDDGFPRDPRLRTYERLKAISSCTDDITTQWTQLLSKFEQWVAGDKTEDLLFLAYHANRFSTVCSEALAKTGQIVVADIEDEVA